MFVDGQGRLFKHRVSARVGLLLPIPRLERKHGRSPDDFASRLESLTLSTNICPLQLEVFCWTGGTYFFQASL